MSDHIRINFIDGSSHTIELEAGTADAEVEKITKRQGTYETGWITDATDPRRLRNLGAAFEIIIDRESDPGPSFEIL